MNTQHSTTYPGLVREHTVFSVAATLAGDLSVITQWGVGEYKHVMDAANRIARKQMEKNQKNYRKDWKKRNPGLRYKGQVYAGPMAMYAAARENRERSDGIANPPGEKRFMCDLNRRINGVATPWHVIFPNLTCVEQAHRNIVLQKAWEEVYVPKYEFVTVPEYAEDEIPF